MADWWADHASEKRSSSENATPDSLADEIVIDTVAAFWGALSRPDDDGAATADLPTEENDEVSSDTLDYFTPAFRRALRGEEMSRPDAAEPDVDEADETARGESPDSLTYFGPAFRRALGAEDWDRGVGNGGTNDAARDGREARDDESAPSLDYFTPAFQRALGNQTEPESQAPERGGREGESEEAFRRLREILRTVTERGFNRLPELKVVNRSRKSTDLAGQELPSGPRTLVSVNGP